MKKFRTWYDTRIEEVEVTRETEQSVFLPAGTRFHKNGERREAKRSDHMNYFDTWDEARDFLIDREKDAIRGHQNDITRHQETLRKIEEMTR